MSQFPAARRPAPLGPRAARALTAELARHGGPKTGLVVGGAAAVVNAAIDALLPDDRLTVVTDSLLVRDAIVAQGRWVAAYTDDYVDYNATDSPNSPVLDSTSVDGDHGSEQTR